MAFLQASSKNLRVRPSLFFLVLFGLLTAGGELLLRISWTPPKPPQHELFTEYNSVYGWKKRANIQKIYAGDEYSTLEIFNSRGIRGPEYPYQKQNNEYRILILGDSQTEGISVAFEDLFSEVLKKELHARGGRSYQVINSGTRAYSTDQELLFFQREGKDYYPDLTILMFSTNNVWGNILPNAEKMPKPLFKLQDGRLELTNVPVPKSKPSAGVQGFIKNHCFLCRFITHQIKHSSFFAWIIKFKLMSMPDYLRILKKYDDDTNRQAWKLTEALLVQLRQETKKAGSRFFVCYVPGADQTDESVWATTRKKYGLVGEEWDPLKVSKELEALCVRNQIQFLNLIPALKSAAESFEEGKKSFYFLSDGHWTREGHKIAGTLLKDYIARNYFMPSSPSLPSSAEHSP